MDNKDTVGFRIKFERERLGLSQSSFAGLCGVAGRAQSYYEADERMPDATYLQAAAAAGVDVLYLLTGMRNENVATTPTEMAYLRNCRAYPTREAREAGLQMLVNLRKAYGIEW